MNRPTLEVAEIIRAEGKRFLQRYGARLRWPQVKALRAIVRCRTAALGGHRDRCTDCGRTVACSYNSCRSRHCPKCQSSARDRWLAHRSRELLPVRYCHVVFTLPQQLAPLLYQNQRLLYRLLFRASAATLLQVARDPRHLGAQIGFLCVLHTWGQNLHHHPHLHCVIPSGGLSPDHRRWIRSRQRFFLPVKVLSRVFRGKFVAGLRRAFREGKLHFYGDQQALENPQAFRALVRSLFRQDWFVYAKPPFGGPDYVLHYLARYTHRVAISNHRLVRFQDGQVSFRWKDYAHGHRQRMMTLTADEFLRRFLLHVLPKGFVRIRSFGFLANRRRATLLSLCRRLLPAPPPSSSPCPPSTPSPSTWRCPACGGAMAIIERFPAMPMLLHSVGPWGFIDTS